jgi:hypothetical protein
MFAWVASWSITSLLLILLVHYIYSFLIDTLTIPKVKDLVHKPIIRYNEILYDISAPKTSPEVQSDMQTELKTFLMNMKQHSQSSGNESTISPGPTPGNNDSAYSAY